MMNAVEIAHLTFTYPGASQPTLRDISLQIQKGDFLAIVGNITKLWSVKECVMSRLPLVTNTLPRI